MDELEQALTQHGMGDPESIKDIIAEVDTDHVRNSFFLHIVFVCCRKLLFGDRKFPAFIVIHA
jgi:hypothetical protein